MVKTEKVGRIAVVTLDRPPGNLFNYRIYDGLADAFSELGRDTDIDVIILKATGKNFTLGHDMEELQKVSRTTSMPIIGLWVKAFLPSIIAQSPQLRQHRD